MPTRKYLVLCLSAAAFSLSPLLSFAQDSPEPVPQASSEDTELTPQATFARESSESPDAGPLETLGEVVVTANRVQESKREVSSNVTVITEEDIKASTAASVADLMVQHGFNVVTTGDTSAVQIRGMGSLSMPSEHENSVLILLNGRRIGMSNLALAGLANVERVEIIRGPSAVQYGSSAMGGVVNIITKRGEEGKPFASVEVGLGSDSLKRESVAFGGAVNGFDFAFGGTHFSRNDMTTKNGRRWYHTEVDKDLAYNLDVGYSFNKNHRIGINLYQGELKSELLDNGGGGIRPYSGNASSSPYTDYRKRNTNTAFSYTGLTNDKSLDWAVSYSFGEDNQNGKSSTGNSWKNTIDNKMFNAQLNYHASMFTLSGGVDQYEYETSGSSVYYGFASNNLKTTIKDTGAYLTGKLRFFNERLIFSAGLRHDRYKNSSDEMDTKKDNHTGGSVGVSYLPTNWLKLRANYAEGFRMPSAQQVGGNAGFWYIPNPSLKPEESKTWEFGADVDWNNASASLTYFHSDWKNKIITQSDMFWNTQFINVKKAEIAGVEGSASWDVGKAFNQRYSLKPYVSFTWLTTRKNKDTLTYIEYHGTDNTLPDVPEWMASYGIDYAHPGLKLKSRLNANYYGKTLTRDRTGLVSKPIGDLYFARPSGTVVNWSLEKGLVDFGGRYGSLTLRAEINNLLDAKNEMYWNYPRQGRNFYLGLRYDY